MNKMLRQDPAPLEQLLLEQNIITSDKLDIALERQKETGDALVRTLVNLGFINDESPVMSLLATQLGVEFVDLKSVAIPPEIIQLIPAKIVSYYKIIPVRYEDGFLTIATAQPQNITIIDGIRVAVTAKVKTVLAGEQDILEAIRRYYGVGADTIDQMMGSIRIENRAVNKNSEAVEIESEASIGKFVNQILGEACRDRATDIHIEPYPQELKIRYRVDGILYDTQVPANIRHFKESINSRIKIMANLNIAEKRLPQDGRFNARVGQSDFDLRVSFLPTQYGESVVIRILSANKLYNLTDLGLSPENLSLLDKILRKPHGIIFVTGPTGSGKTTTLYSCLSHVNQTDKKILTIEDPVEYQLNGIIQLQVNPLIGFTFARGLRSMLRHDPDILMIGEVRDLETAEIAIQSALTGHLVFSTLHTNDAISGITRLIDMGIEPYLIASSVECFIAQRLIRLLCPKCKIPVPANPALITDFALSSEQLGDAKIYEAIGCPACNMTGFRGREGIFEFFFLNEEIRNLLLSKASVDQIKKKAVALGMKTLVQHGWEKVKNGITAPSEIIRVTKDEK